jgi:serine/threonine-protein kinase
LADLPIQFSAALADRYTLERELGRGGMATVYLAQDLKHKRHVALKVLRPELAATLGPDRFRREIETAARLQHPHICSVYDSGETAGQLWFTMPYVRGESLRHRLRRDGRLAVAEALRITAEAGRALDYAHREGIVHRDVKPENLLLTTEGDTLVADFGIARALASAASETQEHLTDDGVAVGTAAYMAPEQATGERTVDARADQYALAVTCYEMLAGQPPFTGPTPGAVIAQRFTMPVPSVRAARPEVPDAANQALQRALAVNPEERFGSMGEFVRGLRAGAASTQPRRVRLVLGALGLAALAAATATLLSRRGAPPATSTESAAPTVTRLAVLPFENLGDSADAYFADGVADAVRGKLTALAGLEVIARASSMAYHKTDKSPQEVARELGVCYLLTGTVRWAKATDGTSRVQVSPELVEVREAGAPASKWQQPFDAALTDVFQVQADIAGRVAQALNVALGTQEQQRLTQRPTADLAAYDAFLKGEAAAQSLASWDLPALRRATTFYEEAVARDSTFGLAWARVAHAHALLYASSASPAEAQAALSALAKAERLAPNVPETYMARAAYEEVVRRDPVRALAATEAGLARAPDRYELMAMAASAELVLGRLDAAVARLRRAKTVDPRSVVVPSFLGWALLYQRRWDEARRALDDALSLVPPDLLALETRAMTYLGEGDLAGARLVLAEAPPAIDRTQLAAYLAWHNDLYWVPDEAAQQQVLTLPPSAFGDDRGTWALLRAQLYHLSGDTTTARVYADSARIAYESQLRANPGDDELHSSRGLALAYLGRKAEAITEGERGAALLPISRDAFSGPSRQHQLVRIYILVGEPEKALDRLEPLLKVPYYLSPGWLRIDPSFAPLRGNPRFERLVAGKM